MVSVCLLPAEIVMIKVPSFEVLVPACDPSMRTEAFTTGSFFLLVIFPEILPVCAKEKKISRFAVTVSRILVSIMNINYAAKESRGYYCAVTTVLRNVYFIVTGMLFTSEAELQTAGKNIIFYI
jgi:hypothetical protein